MWFLDARNYGTTGAGPAGSAEPAVPAGETTGRGTGPAGGPPGRGAGPGRGAAGTVAVGATGPVE